MTTWAVRCPLDDRTPITPPPLECIVYVVRLCSKKKVCWINTRRIVAGMTDYRTFWDWPISKGKTVAMREAFLVQPRIYREHAIGLRASFCASLNLPSPQPTRTRLVNVPPEPHLRRRWKGSARPARDIASYSCHAGNYTQQLGTATQFPAEHNRPDATARESSSSVVTFISSCPCSARRCTQAPTPSSRPVGGAGPDAP